MKPTLVLIVFSMTLSFSPLFAQNSNHHSVDKEIHEGNFRVAILLGHTLIKTEGADSHIFVPSWGMDLEYWFSHKWGVGFHNDIEIESFIIQNPEEEEIVRVNPLVLTLDALYHFHNGFIIAGGPGVELAEGQAFYLFRMGLEYEKSIGNGIDIAPTLFYDHRFDGFSTWTIALGVGKRF